MKAEIVNVGDEILLGQIVNTNATFLSQALVNAGVEPRWITVLGDSREDILNGLEVAFRRADVVLITGGLGPTHDDVTKYAVAEFFQSPLTIDPELYEKLKRRFEARGRPMPEVNRNQAEVPVKATVLPNPAGTAPGLFFEENGRLCFVLPGVPMEMRRLTEESVLPILTQKLKNKGACLRFKTLRTTGIFESKLMEVLGDVAAVEKFASLAFLPHFFGVDLRLTVKSNSASECEKRLQQAENLIRAKVGKYIYGEDNETLEEKVAELLFRTKQTVAVAESCTGGLVSHKLTNIPGSSEYFDRAIVSYSNQAKMENLGVSPQTLEQFGAVSEQTAREMAEGVRQMAGTDWGLSTTGIAGPGGGTAEKPVGLVYIGLSGERETVVRRFIFTNDRLANKERAAYAALELLRRNLLKII